MNQAFCVLPIALTSLCFTYYLHLDRSVLQKEEDQDLPEEGEKGIEMEADFDRQYEDIPENEQDSADEELEGDEDSVQQEMGDVGDAGETVDERLWNNEDKPEEGQNGPEKHEKDSTVQVILQFIVTLTSYVPKIHEDSWMHGKYSTVKTGLQSAGIFDCQFRWIPCPIFSIRKSVPFQTCKAA